MDVGIMFVRMNEWLVCMLVTVRLFRIFTR